ncbi:hypothetical protein ASPCAL15068 [Aspergillus calidoustus]|uniref:Uncharacterized protein n=1 Tax=Aspergillus calidoustus TaxID=454130 RepID=A0A0U5GJC5_ASPCI|nr:hypothetical protein ASPCAL15068 [Aspergillus calidoustus]
MNWRDGIWLWVLCKLGVHARLAARYARFLEQSPEHSLTTSLTCPASRTKRALSTTDASHPCHGSLIPGSAWPNLGPAEALVHQSRRLHRLAGYDANVAVERVRGPTIADTPRSSSVSRDRSLFSPSDGLRKHEDVEGAEYWTVVLWTVRLRNYRAGGMRWT